MHVSTIGRPRLHPRIRFTTAVEALKVLFARLAPAEAAAIVADLVVNQAAGRPFGHLPPPASDREALSREQAGPAILLFRALCRRLDPARALALTREVVVAGATVFLSHTIGPLDRDALSRLSPSELETFAQTVASRFFNATVQWNELSHSAVRFTVTRCLFPSLCRAGSAPEVAPLLCEGDAVYFGEVLGTVELRRAHTIASGGPTCPFELRWKDRSPSASTTR